jgi:hypothetical protein
MQMSKVSIISGYDKTELQLQRLGFDVKHQNPTLEAVVQFFKCFLLAAF